MINASSALQGECNALCSLKDLQRHSDLPLCKLDNVDSSWYIRLANFQKILLNQDNIKAPE